MSTKSKGPQRPGSDSQAQNPAPNSAARAPFDGVRVEVGPDVVDQFRGVAERYAAMGDRFIEAALQGKFSGTGRAEEEPGAQAPILPPAEYLGQLAQTAKMQNVEVHLNLREGVVRIVPVQSTQAFNLSDLGRFT